METTKMLVVTGEQLEALRNAVVDSMTFNGTWADRYNQLLKGCAPSSRGFFLEQRDSYQEKAVTAGKLLTFLYGISCSFDENRPMY